MLANGGAVMIETRAFEEKIESADLVNLMATPLGNGESRDWRGAKQLE
jgi:hypothetical protein